MTPQETKKIVCAVVDYGWPWQIYESWGEDMFTQDGDWITQEDASFARLLKELGSGIPVRLDPNHPHDWPIETREGMPCWRAKHLRPTEFHGYDWYKTHVADMVFKRYEVAPHPLHPDQPPPEDWIVEGKRILK